MLTTGAEIRSVRTEVFAMMTMMARRKVGD
jgi:hypothetical protein